MFSYVTINGFKYAVQQNSYTRKWVRQFTATLVANIVELNFVDKGPGIKTFDFTLMLASWPVGSLPYTNGITQTALQQLTNLETAYKQVASAFNFVDIFGNSLSCYFTDLQITIPNYSTVQEGFIIAQIELYNSSAI